MKNIAKKGQIEIGAMVIIAIALGLVILFAGIFFSIKLFTSSKFLLTAIGTTLIILTLIYIAPKAVEGDLTNKKIKFISLFLIIGVAMILVAQIGIIQNTELTGSSTTTKLAIPHNGAYFCTSVGTGTPSYSIGTSGTWVSKSSIGSYTDQVTSLNIIVPQSIWDSFIKSYFGGGIRAKIQVCDKDQSNCQSPIYQSLTFAGTTTLNLPFTSMNPQTTSLFVIMQSRYTILSSWSNDDKFNQNSKISYAFTKYGLKYVSTTTNPAGELYNGSGCESSCDLTCPEQKSRSDLGLIYTTKNSLNPTESVPVLEYWESLNVDLNAQMGATIYSNNQFCFGGAIYNAAQLKLDNGNTYIYPNTATRQNVECCSGATTSTSQEDKTCVNNKWVTVTKDTRLKCTSDFNCPGQGQNTCQSKLLSGWHCSGVDSTIGKYCVKDLNSAVQCCSQVDCPTDQTCQNNKCVGGAITPPILPPGVNESDSKLSCEAKSPLLGYAWVTENTEQCGFMCKIGISAPTKSTTSYCKSQYMPYYILGIILLVVIVVILLMFKPQKKSSNRKK